MGSMGNCVTSRIWKEAFGKKLLDDRIGYFMLRRSSVFFVQLYVWDKKTKGRIDSYEKEHEDSSIRDGCNDGIILNCMCR